MAAWADLDRGQCRDRVKAFVSSTLKWALHDVTSQLELPRKKGTDVRSARVSSQTKIGIRMPWIRKFLKKRWCRATARIASNLASGYGISNRWPAHVSTSSVTLTVHQMLSRQFPCKTTTTTACERNWDVDPISFVATVTKGDWRLGRVSSVRFSFEPLNASMHPSHHILSTQAASPFRLQFTPVFLDK